MGDRKTSIWAYLEPDCLAWLQDESVSRQMAGMGRHSTYGRIIMELVGPYVSGERTFDEDLAARIPRADPSMPHREFLVDALEKAEVFRLRNARRRGTLPPDSIYSIFSYCLHEAMGSWPEPSDMD